MGTTRNLSSFRGAWFGVALLVLWRAPVVAQVHRGAAPPEQTVRQEITSQFLAERGVLIEILGLRHWTPAMLRDSLAVHAPQAAVASSRLAATLRERLGFPDAIARGQSGDSASNALVAVMEPQESARIRRHAFAGDSTRSLAPWSPLVEQARAGLGLLRDALGPRVYSRAVGLSPTVPIRLRPDSSELRQLWAALDAGRSAEDLGTARRLLTSSPNLHDRLAAVAALSNFEEEDAAWHALVGAILDPDTRVRGLAAGVLATFLSQAPRTIDWAPAAADIHAILDGSELSLLPQVLDMLVATRVAPELAGPLLRDGAYAVLMFAGATNPDVRLPSHRLLRALSGGQERASADAWHAWIAGLGR